MVTKRISVFTVLTVLAVLCCFLTPARANDARSGVSGGTGRPLSPAQLVAVGAGLKTLYLAPGVSSQSNISTAVICTSYAADPDLYPFNVVVEFYEKGGSLVAGCTIAFDVSTRTQTFTTTSTPAYVNDCTANTSAIGQGSLRVLAPKKQAASLLCDAQVLDNDSITPAFSHALDMTRIGKFKAPKDIPAP